MYSTKIENGQLSSFPRNRSYRSLYNDCTTKGLESHIGFVALAGTRRLTDGPTDGPTDGQTDGRTDGRTKRALSSIIE